MQLRPEQIARLRKPFDKLGAFTGIPDEDVKKLLEAAMDYYLTLARIELRIKNEEVNKNS